MLIFCLTETGGGGGGHSKKNCLMSHKFEQIFEPFFFLDLICFKDDSPKCLHLNFIKKTPLHMRDDFDDFPSNHTYGRVVKKKV